MEEHRLGQYAGFSSRLLAYMIDLVFAVAAISITSWLFSTTMELFQVRRVADALGFTWPTFLISDTGVLLSRGLMFFIGIGLYHVFFLSLANRTPGKAILGLQVVTVGGGHVRMGRSILRYLSYLVAIVPLFLGFGWILLDNRRQGWHDKLARTYVVYAWEGQVHPFFLSRPLAGLQQHNQQRFGLPPENGQNPRS